MFIRILENLKELLPSLSHTENLILSGILQNITVGCALCCVIYQTLVLRPLADILSSECQNAINESFLEVLLPYSVCKHTYYNKSSNSNNSQ